MVHVHDHDLLILINDKQFSGCAKHMHELDVVVSLDIHRKSRSDEILLSCKIEVKIVLFAL